MHIIDNGKDETILILHRGTQIKIDRRFFESIIAPFKNEDRYFDYIVMHQKWKYERDKDLTGNELRCPNCDESIHFFITDIQQATIVSCPFCFTYLAFDFEPTVHALVTIAQNPKPCEPCEPKYEDF